MGILEDISKSIAGAATQTAQKTKDMAEITRLNITIGSRENDLQTVYAEIGRKLCEGDVFALPPEVSELGKKVGEIRQEITDMRRKLQQLKNVLVCSDCGFENAVSSKFCANCGARLADQIPVVKAEPVEDIVEVFEDAVEELGEKLGHKLESIKDATDEKDE